VQHSIIFGLLVYATLSILHPTQPNGPPEDHGQVFGITKSFDSNAAKEIAHFRRNEWR
jgi:hypothetical protein